MRTRLDNLAVIAVRGPDSRKFLQGQLSQDMARLSPERARLAGYHTPQGRALAVLRLLPQGPDDVLMILPRELAASVAARLRKYVLRAKTQLLDESAEWQVYGHTLSAPGVAAWADRFVSIEHSGAGGVDAQPPPPHIAASRWRELDIAAGLPQVYAATSEQFVAQMLNLDLLGAIAFDKGCYTGQEIIARAHYRGRVKRRMQRFETRTEKTLLPGDSLKFENGRALIVVDAVRRADGAQEFLAVTSVSAAGADAQAPEDAEAAAASASAAASLAATPLPLPYALPA